MGLLGSIFKAVPVVGDILSASSSKKAAKKAAAAQTEALNKAITALNEQFGISATNLQPSINAGNNAIGGISDLLGLGSSKTQSHAIDNLKGSPLYQALFGNGLEALNANASATGGLRGGNLQDATMDFGRDTLAQVIQQQLSNLGGLAQLGQTANLGLANLGASNAQGIAGLTTGIGNAQAGSILSRQAIDNNLFSGLRQTVGAALGIPTGGFGGGASGGAGGSLFSSLFGGGNVNDSRANGGISGTLPSFLGSSSNPFNLGTIDASPLIQKIGF